MQSRFAKHYHLGLCWRHHVGVFNGSWEAVLQECHLGLLWRNHVGIFCSSWEVMLLTSVVGSRPLSAIIFWASCWISGSVRPITVISTIVLGISIRIRDCWACIFSTVQFPRTSSVWMIAVENRYNVYHFLDPS